MQNEHRSTANSKGRNDEQGNEIRHLYLFCPRFVIKFLCRLNELIYIYKCTYINTYYDYHPRSGPRSSGRCAIALGYKYIYIYR